MNLTLYHSFVFYLFVAVTDPPDLLVLGKKNDNCVQKGTRGSADGKCEVGPSPLSIIPQAYMAINSH